MSELKLFFNDNYDDDGEYSLCPKPKIKVWVDRIVGVIDDGTFFREPVVYVYRVMGVISLAACLAMCIAVTKNLTFGNMFFGSFVNVAVLVLASLAVGILTMMIWINRSNKLRTRIAAGSDIVVIPLVADFVQTCFECLGFAVMVILPVCSVFFGFVGQLLVYRGYFAPDFSSVLLACLCVAILSVLMGYGFIVLGHFLGENMRAFATLVNNVCNLNDVNSAVTEPIGEAEQEEPAEEEKPEEQEE